MISFHSALCTFAGLGSLEEMSDSTEKLALALGMIQQCVQLLVLGWLEEMSDSIEKIALDLALALEMISFNSVYICWFWGRLKK